MFDPTPAFVVKYVGNRGVRPPKRIRRKIGRHIRRGRRSSTGELFFMKGRLVCLGGACTKQELINYINRTGRVAYA